MRPSFPNSATRQLLAALVALLILSGLTACLPASVPGVSSPVVSSATQTPRPTPVATIAGAPAPTPIAPVRNLVPARTLAFVSDRDGRIDLWLMDIETRQLWRLTNDTAIESFPTWSPDGTMLAYVVEDERANRNLWILDLRTGIHRQLTHEDPPFDVHRPAWLSGGRVLIYDTGKPFDRRPELRAVTTDGQKLAPLLPDNGSIIWDWSTNGETLVCAVGPQLGEPHIVVTDAVPGAALHPQPAAPVGFAVELSPFGRYATFSGPPLSDDQVTSLLTIATGAVAPFNDKDAANEPVPGRRYEHDFAWLPDAQRLVFVHGAGGVTDGQGRLKGVTGPPPTSDGYVGLWLITRDRQRERLTTGSADAAPRPSPDGRWIAYLTDAQEPSLLESNIMIIPVDPLPGTQVRVPQNLTAGNGNNWSPAWMPLQQETTNAPR
jgi:Tol biopolymer transport system component